MIDHSSRNRLALAIRRFVSGRISNDDLDGVDVDWRDRGAVAVQRMAWNLYDDNYNHFAKGRHAIAKQYRRDIARWIVFLQSDDEYLWPEYSFERIYIWFIDVLTFGFWGRWEERRWREFCAAGDIAAWPFLSATERDAAMRATKYLGRAKAAQA